MKLANIETLTAGIISNLLNADDILFSIYPEHCLNVIVHTFLAT